MGSFEDTVKKAVADGVLPGLVVFAQDVGGEDEKIAIYHLRLEANANAGKLSYAEAFGKTSVGGDAKDMQLDTPLQIASMTKLLTTIAVLQLVDRELVGLDDDVERYIPEFVKEGLLKDVEEDGKPVTKPIKNKVTLRLLLTHSSGSIYDGYLPKLQRVKQFRGIAPNAGTTLEERALLPLIFEPGTSWVYGFGIDWAGRVLERITGDTLDAWMKKNMWPQLGIKKISFYPFMVIDPANLPHIATRNEKTGGLAPVPPKGFLNYGNKDSFGGHGAVASMDEYIKVLHSLLINDGKLLKPATADQMFQPHLTPEAKARFHSILGSPAGDVFVGDFPEPEQYDWGLGGLLVERDNEGRRKKGTLIWSGMANCYWFIDRKAGLCGVFGAQVLPPGDKKVGEVIKSFEYEMNRKLSAKL
ncbi:beta-lactamase family protein [Myriangium duriaei CBS 260.36]|uniref:Beta-lactamase family protein n=1 Tax=Myriangium duriaei CBS 260.36 TaxID=1168546 RepID=A0A9P4MG92_9PEZI|nr:beta-lactamase family protein [Myriangium duriaei CBS 260.36]